MEEGQKQVSKEIVPSFAVSLEEVEARIQMLQQFVKRYMIKGEDYGEVPGIPKPTLLKPGAEKLCDVYGFSKMVEVKNRVEDWEKGFFHYEVKVTLTNKRTGLVEAEGVGSCNSKEKKYRYQDAYTIVNTVLKMGKKRALIDAVLSATRSSGMFTQDIEDLDDVVPGKSDTPKSSTEKQRKYILTLAKGKQFTEDQLKSFCTNILGQEKASKDWTTEEASRIIDALNQAAGAIETQKPPNIIN